MTIEDASNKVSHSNCKDIKDFFLEAVSGIRVSVAKNRGQPVEMREITRSAPPPSRRSVDNAHVGSYSGSRSSAHPRLLPASVSTVPLASQHRSAPHTASCNTASARVRTARDSDASSNTATERMTRPGTVRTESQEIIVEKLVNYAENLAQKTFDLMMSGELGEGSALKASIQGTPDVPEFVSVERSMRNRSSGSQPSNRMHAATPPASENSGPSLQIELDSESDVLLDLQAKSFPQLLTESRRHSPVLTAKNLSIISNSRSRRASIMVDVANSSKLSSDTLTPTKGVSFVKLKQSKKEKREAARLLDFYDKQKREKELLIIYGLLETKREEYHESINKEILEKSVKSRNRMLQLQAKHAEYIKRMKEKNELSQQVSLLPALTSLDREITSLDQSEVFWPSTIAPPTNVKWERHHEKFSMMAEAAQRRKETAGKLLIQHALDDGVNYGDDDVECLPPAHIEHDLLPLSDALLLGSAAVVVPSPVLNLPLPARSHNFSSVPAADVQHVPNVSVSSSKPNLLQIPGVNGADSAVRSRMNSVLEGDGIKVSRTGSVINSQSPAQSQLRNLSAPNNLSHISMEEEELAKLRQTILSGSRRISVFGGLPPSKFVPDDTPVLKSIATSISNTAPIAITEENHISVNTIAPPDAGKIEETSNLETPVPQELDLTTNAVLQTTNAFPSTKKRDLPQSIVPLKMEDLLKDSTFDLKFVKRKVVTTWKNTSFF
ncbi:hypothetical protein HDU82_006625 [Entophlyctis luteolus]|nr:hypothetical protein HDU82_006625 [Entophlyctis luteolus]